MAGAVGYRILRGGWFTGEGFGNLRGHQGGWGMTRLYAPGAHPMLKDNRFWHVGPFILISLQGKIVEEEEEQAEGHGRSPSTPHVLRVVCELGVRVFTGWDGILEVWTASVIRVWFPMISSKGSFKRGL